MSIAVYYARLESVARSRLGAGVATTLSTDEIAANLNTSLEEAVRIYQAYNEQKNRIFEFEKSAAPFKERYYHRLIVRPLHESGRS